MHECVLICHACIHQPLKAVTAPSVEPIAEFIQVTLKKLDIHTMEHIEQLPLGVAYYYMYPWQDLAYLPWWYHLGVVLLHHILKMGVRCGGICDYSRLVLH